MAPCPCSATSRWWWRAVAIRPARRLSTSPASPAPFTWFIVATACAPPRSWPSAPWRMRRSSPSGTARWRKSWAWKTTRFPACASRTSKLARKAASTAPASSSPSAWPTSTTARPSPPPPWAARPPSRPSVSCRRRKGDTIVARAVAPGAKVDSTVKTNARRRSGGVFSMPRHSAPLVFCFSFALLPLGAHALPSAPLGTFLDKHCVECHDADTKKGDLDLTSLPTKLDEAANFALWAKVHDRVRAGEMPPEKKARPEAPATEAAMTSLAKELTLADAAREQKEGRAYLRRLNRVEFE